MSDSPKKQEKSDLLGTESVGRLLWKISLPATVASLVQAVYNIVDRLYIGRSVGTEAMAGLTLTFPYMMVLAAFGVLVGAGSSALLSIKLGEGDRDSAEKLVGQCVALKLLFFVTVPVVAYIFLDQTLVMFGGTPESIPAARSYLEIILIGNVFSHLAFGLSAMIRAGGNATRSMLCMIIGAVSNIILDPLFIFGGIGIPDEPGLFFIDLGLPAMGIRGAAWATNIAMFLSALFAVSYFFGKHAEVKLRVSRIRIYRSLVGAMLLVGMPPCIHHLIMSAINVLYNRAFKDWSPDSYAATQNIAAFGLVSSVLMFGMMPLFGISHGVQPIIGYNFGARKYPRMMKCFKLGMLYGTIFCVANLIVCETFAPQLASLFTKDAGLHESMVWGLRVTVASCPFIAGPMISTMYFQSIGRARTAIILSSLRQVVMLIPLIIALPFFFGVKGVWFSGPVSDFLAFVITMTVVMLEFRRIRRLKALHEREQVASLEASAI